jgi:hypothetical protein
MYNIYPINVQYPVPNFQHFHALAPSIARHPFMLVHYQHLHAHQPPHLIHNFHQPAQQNQSSLQQQTRFVLRPPPLVLQEPQLSSSTTATTVPQIDPRLRFEQQNNRD